MKLEDQVCSLGLAKRLKELGVKQESYFYWLKDGNEWRIFVSQSNYTDGFSAFTVAELGEMLGAEVSFKKVQKDPPEFGVCVDYCQRIQDPIQHHWVWADTESAARAKMLIYLIENGMVKP